MEKEMKTITYLKLLFVVFLSLPILAIAQGVAINEDNSEADPSAILDIKSSDKGVLLPRMTETEISAIVSPANGLMVFNTTDDKFYTFLSSEGEWKEIVFGSGIINGPFTCGDQFTDVRDGQSYSTVQFGTQCWMAENLNIGTMLNVNTEQTNDSNIEKYCYGNNTVNCDTYGGLYQWDEMMDYTTTAGSQGICPSGWHIPTEVEWCTLENYVDAGTLDCNRDGWDGTDGGGNLKETGTAHWTSPNVGATNSTGFSGRGTGYRHMNGTSSIYFHDYTFMWSSDEDGAANAFRHRLGSNTAQISRASVEKVFGLSVRCLKD